MASVRVHMMGTLKAAYGELERELSIPCDADAALVVRMLAEECGDKFEATLLDPVLGNPLPNVLILLNGVEIDNLEGLETPVDDGDVLTFLSVTHGG